MIPVTSTKLEIIGLLINAGSKPRRFRIKGVSAPTKLPQITTVATDAETVPPPAPWPRYRQEAARHEPSESVAKQTKREAQGQAINTSWRNTRNQSLGFNSPKANARVIKVADCEPQLPPAEMMSGTKNTSGGTPSNTL